MKTCLRQTASGVLTFAGRKFTGYDIMDQTSATFSAYAARLSYTDLTADAIHATKRCVVDALGCALGAFDAEPVVATRAIATQIVAQHPATLIGTRLKSSAEMAGFVNGTMIRYSDFSDDYFGGNGMQAGPHPSDNIGSLLAVTECGGGSGKDLILGIALAYEICDQLVDHAVMNPRGWDYPVMHAAGTALGAGKVMGLNQEQLAHALGLAIVPNVCLGQTRKGDLSNWKGLAGPNGSRNGLFAAMLARHGITGPAEPFEGKAGLMKQLGVPFSLGKLGGDGIPYKIEGTYFKFLPIMYSTQLFVWTALELRKKVVPDDIASITVFLSAYHLSVDAFDPARWDPKTRETADHSGPYLIGAALIDGKITADTMTPQRYRNPEILALTARIKVAEDKEYTAAYPRVLNCRMEATLKSGQVVSAWHSFPKGHPANPMSDREISDKFLDQAGSWMPASQAQDLLDTLWKLDEVKQLDTLFELLLVQGKSGD